MYQIGEFSKINRVTAKTLRHYDEIGLLKPEHVDDFTGYRYYSSNQLPRMHQIITLKQMGLSLLDIKQVMENPMSMELFLKLKEKELEKAIKEETLKLLQLQNYLKRLRGEFTMSYNPVIKSLPEVIVASMRTIIESYDTYFDIMPKMGDEMRRQGAVCAEPAYCFCIYHDGEYKETNIDVEACESVVDFCEDSEMVKYKVIQRVDSALCVLHKGPYSLLREAYVFAFEWIKDNGYEVAGLPRESYIDGIWNKEDESEWLTELQIPIQKK